MNTQRAIEITEKINADFELLFFTHENKIVFWHWVNKTIGAVVVSRDVAKWGLKDRAIILEAFEKEKPKF